MSLEDGYCDRCGCECPDTMWLNIMGEALCRECAEEGGDTTTRAKRPEARDDGR